MKVSVKQVCQKMHDVLTARNYSQEDIDFIIDMFLGGELSGHITHGLASFASFANKDRSNLENPEVIKQTSALYLLDAKSNPGVVVGRQAADEAIKRAKTEFVGISIVKNMEIWLRPGGIAKYIADQGYLAIIINDAPGAAIAPPGGFDPTLGTNPIAYGIPMGDKPLIVDLATSKMAWGQVRLANKYGTNLPADTFYDNEGNITLDPKRAHSIKSFGDHKGYALALLIEVLCGSLIGKAMMVTDSVQNSFVSQPADRVGMIFVIDPSETVGLDKLQQDNTDLIQRIKASSPLDGQEIRIPGEKASELEAEAYANDEIELPDELWAELQAIA